MKETFYFSHDYNSRNDTKLVEVMMTHGIVGIGAFWCIVEMLYEEGGYLPLKYERITFELRTDKNVIQSIINDFGLFENNGEKFWSNSIIDRLKKRQDKSEKAKQSIQKRWDKHKDTNVLRTKNECNTIKERKGKENKINNISKDIETEVSEIKEISISQNNIDKKEVYGSEEINDIIKAIKEKHGIVDGPIQEQRNFGNLLVKKIKTIEGFNGDFYNFIKTIIEQSDSFRIGKTTSPKKIYYNLADLIANIRANIEKNKPKGYIDLSKF